MARTSADDESSDEDADGQEFGNAHAMDMSVGDVHNVLDAAIDKADVSADSHDLKRRAKAVRHMKTIYGSEEALSEVDTSGNRPTLSVQDLSLIHISEPTRPY